MFGSGNIAVAAFPYGADGQKHAENDREKQNSDEDAAENEDLSPVLRIFGRERSLPRVALIEFKAHRGLFCL